MNKKFYIMTVTALMMALGMSQSVMAKKITYLGHYYNGKVKDKIPQGEGGIAIANVAVFGTFNANNITNAKIEEDWIKITGEISFDESDRITVKAGSNISSTVYLSSTIKNITNEDNLRKRSMWVKSYDFQKTLEKDSIVDLASTHADFYVSREVCELAPNPPTIISQIHAELVPIEISYDVKDVLGRNTGKTAKRQTKVYKIEEEIAETEYRLDNYKDKYGRIWNVVGPIRKDKCVGKVTYPNGSYIETDENGNIKDFEIKNENNFVVKNKYVFFSDGTKISFSPSFDSDKQFRTYISKPKIYYAYLADIIFPKSQTTKLSNNEITKLINDKISQAFVNYRFHSESDYNLNVYDGSYDNKVGKYNENSGYISYKEQKANEAAAMAAEAKALNAKTANFKKKYGFDPSINNVRSIVKVGRNVLAVIDARNEWQIEYGNKANQISVKLVKDQGANKCYEFYSKWGAFYCGYFWTNNNVITSIYWGPKRFR